MSLIASLIGVLAATRERNFEAEPTLPLTLLGTWPLSETAGNTFADTVAGNTATLAVPSWTVATHEWNRLGIAVGTDHALEVSNGGPAIPMAVGYKNVEVSLAFYVCPLGELRGEQHWNTSAEGYRREFLAHCDDGSTPGSFAIERRKFSATEWRLDGYVRNGSGTAVRFSGGLNGISGATLPVDVAKRIVLTQSTTNGAKLYLDGSLVGSLGAVTTGWGSLSTAITLGSSSNTGHANDRSPFWGRIDEIKVWQGNLDLTAVQALAAASSTRLWRYPSDFVGGSTDINIATAGSIQAAVDAAHAASPGRYVYQLDSDTTYYGNSITNDSTCLFKPNCKGMLGVRLKFPASMGGGAFKRLVNIANTDFGQMGNHGDPLAGVGGWKFIGCRFDGNGRSQDWHPVGGTPGFTYYRYDHEQRHAFYLKNTATMQTLTIDACQFYDGQGDAISISQNSAVTSKSCRFYGYFRGSIVVNAAPNTTTAIRYESFSRAELNSILNGCGLQDIEPFTGEGNLSQCTFRDAWADADFDDQNEGQSSVNSYSRYYNCHLTGAGHMIIPAGQTRLLPTQDWQAQYCTFSYHNLGGDTGSPLYPPAWWAGMPQGDNGYGCLFDHCIFVANAMSYFRDGDPVTPAADTDYYIEYHSDANEGPRIWTQRSCEWRVKAGPNGTPTGSIRCVNHQTVGSTKIVELDGVLIDAAFDDFPFDMGSATVRYHNVLHERVGHPNPTKPWTDAGAEVPF